MCKDNPILYPRRQWVPDPILGKQTPTFRTITAVVLGAVRTRPRPSLNPANVKTAGRCCSGSTSVGCDQRNRALYRSVSIPTPQPGVSEILIRVHAAGVNPIDGANRETGAFVGGEAENADETELWRTT